MSLTDVGTPSLPVLLLVRILVEPLLLDRLPLVKHALVVLALGPGCRERVHGGLAAPRAAHARRARLVPKRPPARRARVRVTTVERKASWVVVGRRGGVAVAVDGRLGEVGHRVAQMRADRRAAVVRVEGWLLDGLVRRRGLVRVLVDKVVGLVVSLLASLVACLGRAPDGLLRGRALRGPLLDRARSPDVGGRGRREGGSIGREGRGRSEGGRVDGAHVGLARLRRRLEGAQLARREERQRDLERLLLATVAQRLGQRERRPALSLLACLLRGRRLVVHGHRGCIRGHADLRWARSRSHSVGTKG